jgi:cytochrome c553
MCLLEVIGRAIGSSLELQNEDVYHVMKKLFAVMLFTAAVLFLMLPNLSWADDAAASYKTKCAMCHGADAKGKGNIPDLTSDKVKKATDAELEDFIANGGKDKKASHAFAAKGVDAKAMVAYIRSLK